MGSSKCECGGLEDLAIVPMGNHDDVFRTLEEVTKRGSPFWWLYLSACRVCGQRWLIAQEERHNDLFIFRRLSHPTAERIIQDNDWPTDFDRYETLLEIGRAAGRSVRFFDVSDSPLLDTVMDLARERPGICVSELASLLNLDPNIAGELARQVVNMAEVKITFDAK